MLAAAIGAAFLSIAFIRATHAAASGIVVIPVAGELGGGIVTFDRSFVVPPGTAQIDIDVDCPGDEVARLEFGARGPAGVRGWTSVDHVHMDAISASHGYLPGPIEPGEWHVMAGGPLAARSSPTAFEMTIRLSDRLDTPRPTVTSRAGWFAGDLHTHTGHGDGYHTDRGGRSTPVFVFELATRARSAGLDFLAVTEHNTASHWVDVDRVQTARTDLLLLHGREITTPEGHFNAIGERRVTEFQLTPFRSMSRLLLDAGKDGAFLSINHPWLESSEWCYGCGWSGADPEALRFAHGVEVVNGSTPTGARLPGWSWWAERLNHGARLVAVGGSDLHDPEGGKAAIGKPSTVVWSSALSEERIVAGLKSGRAFVRLSPDDPASVDLHAAGVDAGAAMGQAIRGGTMTLSATVAHAAGAECEWIRRGAVIRTVRITRDEWIDTLPVDARRGDWFSVIVRARGRARLISNAIYVN